MTRRGGRWGLLAAVGGLYLLHQDDWLAASDARFMGLPASLAWHLGLCLLTALVMGVAVRFAWPRDLQDGGRDPDAP